MNGGDTQFCHREPADFAGVAVFKSKGDTPFELTPKTFKVCLGELEGAW